VTGVQTCALPIFQLWDEGKNILHKINIWEKIHYKYSILIFNPQNTIQSHIIQSTKNYWGGKFQSYTKNSNPTQKITGGGKFIFPTKNYCVEKNSFFPQKITVGCPPSP
jgi:hypothetical protein